MDILGYGGVCVPNQFFRQPAGSAHLGVILPGVQYTSAMPLLYYAGCLLIEGGADMLTVDYDYRSLVAMAPRQELEEGCTLTRSSPCQERLVSGPIRPSP